MSAFLGALRRFLRSEDGPTAVEYAIMLAFILLVCIGLITAIGSTTAQSFSDSGQQIVNSAS